MKRKFLYTLIAALVLTFTIVMISHKPADVEASTPLTVEQLFTNYYDDGAYTKETEIFVDTDKVGADFFHAGVTHLKRITYYKPDKLWMTNKERTINSGYGTSENGHLTHFVKDLNDTSIELDVVEYDWLPGMEEYYLTLHDFMVGTHNSAHSNNEDLNLASGWTYSNGVYTNSNVDLIEAYRLFTAPLFLQLNETNKHYFSFSHVTLEVVDNKLVMCLWVDGDNEGVMTSELVDGHYLFSKAVINCHEYNDFTYGGTISGTAEYDAATGTYSFKCNFATWNRISFTYNGVVLNPQNTNFQGLFNTTSGSATWTEVLYSEDNVLWLVSKTGGHNYIFTYDPVSNTLTASSAGLVWGGTWSEVGKLNANGEYEITKAFNIWNRVTLTYDGKLLTLDDLTVTGAFASTGVVGKLYHENGQFLYAGKDGQVFKLTFNPETYALNIEAVKEELGLTYEIEFNISDAKVVKNSDGTFTLTFVTTKNWAVIDIYYNGKLLTWNNVNASGDACQSYNHMNGAPNILYFGSDSGIGWCAYDQGNDGGETYTIIYNPSTNDMIVSFTH